MTEWTDDLGMQEPDAIDEAIENDCTIHCSLCGAAFDLSGNGEGMVLEGRRPLFGRSIPEQVKLCIDCAIQAAAAVERLLHESDVCEHGVVCGEWCEPCNVEYKRAALDPDNANT